MLPPTRPVGSRDTASRRGRVFFCAHAATNFQLPNIEQRPHTTHAVGTRQQQTIHHTAGDRRDDEHEFEVEQPHRSASQKGPTSARKQFHSYHKLLPRLRQVLSHLGGLYATIGLLLYGSGLRLLEALRLRIKDVDFARLELTVCEGKGNKDRRTMLSSNAVAGLQRQIELSRQYLESDLKAGFGTVELSKANRRRQHTTSAGNTSFLRPTSVSIPAVASAADIICTNHRSPTQFA